MKMSQAEPWLILPSSAYKARAGRLHIESSRLRNSTKMRQALCLPGRLLSPLCTAGLQFPAFPWSQSHDQVSPGEEEHGGEPMTAWGRVSHSSLPVHWQRRGSRKDPGSWRAGASVTEWVSGVKAGARSSPLPWDVEGVSATTGQPAPAREGTHWGL